MEQCFYFFRGIDSLDIISEDLDNILTSNSWIKFVSNLPNDQPEINNLIDLDKLVSNIAENKYDRKYPFTHYNNNTICDSFKEKPSISFLQFLASNIDDKRASNFLNSIISRYPETLLKLKLVTKLNNSQKDIIAEAAFKTAFMSKNGEIMPILRYLPESTMRAVFKYLSSENEKFSMDVATQAYSGQSILDLLREEVTFSLNNSNLFHVNFILNFIEKNENKFFTYADAFKHVFAKQSCRLLSDILVSRVSVTRTDILQVQTSILSPADAAPILKTMQKIVPQNVFSDDQIRQFGVMFDSKKEIPSIINQMFIVDKSTLENSLIPAIESMAKKDRLLALLYDEMKKQKMVPKRKESPLKNLKIKDVNLENLATFVDELSIRNGNFCSELFDAFNACLYTRHKEDVKRFMADFDKNFLQKISIKSLNTITERAVDYLCGDLSVQHRFSLCTLALRLPINNYIQKLFDCGKENEVRTLAFLHDASITTAEYIKLRETTFYNEENVSLAVLDRISVLRYRWRYLRSDANTFVYGLPEHLSLCENDQELFLKWELAEDEPEQRNDIIAKLGIEYNENNLKVILSARKVSKNCMEALADKFENSKLKKIPSFINIHSACFFPLVWDRKVLSNASFKAGLLKFPEDVAKSFIKFAPDDYQKICEEFPMIISTVLVNDIVTTYEVFDRAMLSLRRTYDFSGESLAFVAAVVCAIYRKNEKINIFEFSFLNWRRSCLFFSIMNRSYDDSIKLLENDVDLCSELLRNDFENMYFCNVGSWSSHVVRFIVHCAITDFFIDNEIWLRLLNCCRYAPWPSDLSEDSEYFAAFDIYLHKHKLNFNL